MNTLTKFMLVAGCLAAGSFATANAATNDFPTLERVRFVQECMALKGGNTYENMSGCSCMVDHVADQMTFDEFVHADAFTRLKNMRGERGGYFRSSSTSRKARKELAAVKKNAESRCFTGLVITRTEQ